jgi:hypothetical protein
MEPERISLSQVSDSKNICKSSIKPLSRMAVNGSYK